MLNLGWEPLKWMRCQTTVLFMHQTPDIVLHIAGAPGHVPLKPKRPGREAIDRLWCSGRDPPDDGGAATESTSSPQLLPAKLLRRGEAPGDRPLPSKSSGDWLEVSAESSAVPAVAAERGQEEPSGLSNSQDCILDQPRQPVGFKILRPSQTSSKVASASRKMVMFMEEHPDSPAADVGRGAERLAEELVGQVRIINSRVHAQSAASLGAPRQERLVHCRCMTCLQKHLLTRMWRWRRT